jgi:protocatechuate 3,4-dioxygenase alpha subunit
MIMDLVPTPSQTIGPFFHFCLTLDTALGCLAGPDAKGERIRLTCRVLDGDGAPMDDAMIEIWQADADGNYDPPDGSSFRGFGRLCTDENGVCVFQTVKPGQVPGPGGTPQAPHVDVLIFARGLLKQLVTRIYFDGEAANRNDPILALVPEDRRETLLAHPYPEKPSDWIVDIRLCHESETVFFDV